jgi:hypothetical protein
MLSVAIGYILLAMVHGQEHLMRLLALNNGGFKVAHLSIHSFNA